MTRRRLVRMLVLMAGLLLAACDVSTPPTTTNPPLPPPDPPDVMTTTTSLLPDVPITEVDEVHYYRGSLPDGTDYFVSIRAERDEEVTAVDAPIFFSVGPRQIPAGYIRMVPTRALVEPRYDGRVFSTSTGGWLVDIYFESAVVETLGDDAEEVITTSFEFSSRNGLPVVSISEPFGWNHRLDPFQVIYETFVVRPLCGGLSVSCSGGGAIQIIPSNRLDPLGPGLMGKVEEVSSGTTRPVSDPHYLDLGPLSPRTDADVHWTGERMIVWGGGQGGESNLVDGAIFDPETAEWTMLPPFPPHRRQATRSIWLGSLLMVVSGEGTYLYFPEGNRWDVLDTSGVVNPVGPGLIEAWDDRAYIWNADGVWSLNLTSQVPNWSRLPDPPFVTGDRFLGDRHFNSMVVSDDLFYVSLRSDEGCESRRIAKWNGEEWRLLPQVTLGTYGFADCSYAHQWAPIRGGLVVWDTLHHETLMYSARSDAWTDSGPMPLGGQTELSGGVAMGEHLFLVPQFPTSAIFDASSGAWTEVSTPEGGDETSIVWTGSEFLAWTGFDAWRWAPPEGHPVTSRGQGRVWAATFLVLLLTACENTSAPTTTRPPLAPPDGEAMPVPTTDAPVPSSTGPLPLVYNGFLANGAHYVARIPGERPEFAGSVGGNFSYMSENRLIPVGEVRYRRARPSSFQVGYDSGLLRLQSENWLVEVEFDSVVLADLGESAEEAATRSITLEVLEDTPILRLASPFTWVEGMAQVVYETFVIASGCWKIAVQCSDNRSVQLLSAPEMFVQTRGLTPDQIDNLSIESSTGRAVSDPNYLYPGPLEPRLSADLIWTGEEFLAWGIWESFDSWRWTPPEEVVP